MLLSALGVLTLLATLAVLVSGVPSWAAWPCAAAVLSFGIARARGESRRPHVQLVINGGDSPATVDGEAVESMGVEWRGPIAFLQWRRSGGPVRRLVFWPDTLSAEGTRELRLATGGGQAARKRS